MGSANQLPGLVPPLLSPSKRVLNEKGAFRNPLAPAIVPEPSFNVPFHCALAFEMAISVSLVRWGGEHNT